MATTTSSSEELKSPPPDVSQFHHTPFYCEENVYSLCKKLCMNGIADAEGSDLFVVFISNEKKQIPLWHQKASHRADGIVLWDYNVICIQRRKEDNSVDLVWDLDSSLPFPSPLGSYVSESIRPSFQLFSEFQRFFRIVHAPIFLRCFASDRRHMKDSEGNWMYPPPSHEPIVAEDGTVHNLNEYMCISTADVVQNVGASLINDVFTSKFGVLMVKTSWKSSFPSFLKELEWLKVFSYAERKIEKRCRRTTFGFRFHCFLPLPGYLNLSIP